MTFSENQVVHKNVQVVCSFEGCGKWIKRVSDPGKLIQEERNTWPKISPDPNGSSNKNIVGNPVK